MMDITVDNMYGDDIVFYGRTSTSVEVQSQNTVHVAASGDRACARRFIREATVELQKRKREEACQWQAREKFHRFRLRD